MPSNTRFPQYLETALTPTQVLTPFRAIDLLNLYALHNSCYGKAYPTQRGNLVPTAAQLRGEGIGTRRAWVLSAFFLHHSIERFSA